MQTHVHTRLPDARAEALAVASRGQRRARVLVWALTLALLLLGAVALTAAGAIPILADTSALGGMGSRQPTPETVPDQSGNAGGQSTPASVEAKWDGPVVHLDWEGKQYSTAEATFVGDRVLSPGDRIEHTLSVGNAGPSEAVAQVTLVPHRNVPEKAQNRAFGDDVTVMWDVAGVSGTATYGELLRAPSRAIAEVAVAQGEQIAVKIGVVMDSAAETSRALDEASTTLDFEVDVRLSGALVPGEALPLAITGAVLPVALVLFAIVLVALGLLLFLARRRKRDEEVVVREEG